MSQDVATPQPTQYTNGNGQSRNDFEQALHDMQPEICKDKNALHKILYNLAADYTLYIPSVYTTTQYVEKISSTLSALASIHYIIQNPEAETSLAKKFAKQFVASYKQDIKDGIKDGAIRQKQLTADLANAQRERLRNEDSQRIHKRASPIAALVDLKEIERRRFDCYIGDGKSRIFL
ncbi:MAG: hypothetical protein AAB649_06945 [Patescibacteria group bacterium]